MTNTVPTAPFRGAGRPEATAVMERLIDIAAQRLKIDRVELRRRNLIRHDKLPHRTATGLTYDSGDFAGNLARALESADWKGFPARRKEAKKRGRLLGIGVANYVEPRWACRTSAWRSTCPPQAASILSSERNRAGRATKRASGR